jgi:hypothetical protein
VDSAKIRGGCSRKRPSYYLVERTVVFSECTVERTVVFSECTLPVQVDLLNVLHSVKQASC